ncbi:MAG: hypothetical protein J2P24_03210 [Streptosporangiales bacterium]|nr:hypothetical protein [Streptosporangiales bacterium]
MTKPLQPGDPRTFGPFVVDARLADSPSGVVFLGSDDDGRRAAIAALVGPASADPAMQERFRDVANPGALYDGGEGVRVLAADLDATQPWVATAYDGIRPSAERVFEQLSTDDPTARYFQPFTQYPAEEGYLPRAGKTERRRAWWWWLAVGLVLLGILLALLVFLAQCGAGGPGPGPSGSPSRSTSGTPSQSPSQSSSASQSPSQSSSASQSPSRSSGSRSGSPTPSGTGSGSRGTLPGTPTGPPLHLPLPTP